MLRFYEDPGHGWLEVPVAELRKLGILGDITPYSYVSRDRKLAYLEEDCDMSTYARAAGKPVGMRNWGDVQVVRSNDDSFVRDLPSIAVLRQSAQLELV